MQIKLSNKKIQYINMSSNVNSISMGQCFIDPYFSSQINNERETKQEITIGCHFTDSAIANLPSQEENRPLTDSFYTKKEDSIENITVQIFAHLCSFADRFNRSDVEAATTSTPHESIGLSNSIYSLTSSSQEEDAIVSPTPIYSHCLRPFQRETNFYRDDNEPPIHIRNVVRHIVSGFTRIFFGWELIDKQKDPRTFEEMITILAKDRTVWKKKLREYYSPGFQYQMNTIFSKADELAKERKYDKKLAYIQRVTFYATLIIFLIGKLKGQKAVSILGLIASSATFLFMVIYHGKISFKQSQQEIDLKDAIERLYPKTALHRITKF